jgi:maltooligosyltrehalose trehalohydrolase
MTAGERYRVWAPRASTVVLRVDSSDVPMQQSGGGWWAADRARRAGERYGYLVDGDGPLPDPRSAFQPEGVHGLSAVVDHGAFAWTDAGWQAPPLASAVLYELHVGTFTPEGTFDAAIAKLPHLVDLGVTHVELMPVCEFAGPRGWGYDGVDLFAPHHAYGGPDGLKRLIDACHARGLAVVIDVVYNHLGPAGNYLGRFGPYFTDRYRTPWGDAVNFDGAGSDEVRRFVCDNALMWLRAYHADGLRIDAVHAIVDTSAVHLLEQLAIEVDALEAALGRHLVLIAESDLNDPRIVWPRERGGYGIDAQWSDDFHHALHTVLTGERSGYYEDFGTLDQLAAALRDAFVYGGVRSRHRGRVHGRAPHGVPGSRFVVAAQNHDQIGNRARGDRLAHLVSPGRLRIAAALLLTAPYVPLLFQGEEWGASSPFLYFTSHDEELGRLVAEGRRREFAAFGWDPEAIPDPQAPGTFARSRLDWDEIARPGHHELLEWHRALLALRRHTPALRDPDRQSCRVEHSGPEGWIVVRRRGIATACNLDGTARTVPLGRPAHVLLASSPAVRLRGTAIDLPPESAAIVAVAEGAAA